MTKQSPRSEYRYMRYARGDNKLYEDGESVRCMCMKCGWVGMAIAPMFPCGGCSRYVASPIDRDKRRAEAAEARCARLEKAIRTVRPSLGYGYAPDGKSLGEILDEALSDTAQQDIYCDVCGAHVPATDVDEACGRPPGCAYAVCGRPALPLDPETGAADDSA